MNASFRVTYLDHSAVAVDDTEDIMIFDYARRERGSYAEGFVDAELLGRYKRAFVFASHGHDDHYVRDIFNWCGATEIHYVLGFDITHAPIGTSMSPGDSVDLAGDVSVTAHASTDLGVSFLVSWKGRRIFHAGDLNLWHWRDESTLREIEQAEKAYYAAIEPLENAAPDVAFFPVDPRQGEMYDAGAIYFIEKVKPAVLVPIHWQGRADVAHDFARHARNRHTKVLAMTERGESYSFTRDGGAVTLAKTETLESLIERGANDDNNNNANNIEDIDGTNEINACVGETLNEVEGGVGDSASEGEQVETSQESNDKTPEQSGYQV